MPIKSIYVKPEDAQIWLKLEEYVASKNKDGRRKKLSKSDIVSHALDKWLSETGSVKSDVSTPVAAEPADSSKEAEP